MVVSAIEKTADHARRAEDRHQRRQEAVDEVEDPIDGEDSDDNKEMKEAHVRAPQRRVRGPAAAPPWALNPGMWLNMINVKPLYLANLEIESVKKFILDYIRDSQK